MIAFSDFDSYLFTLLRVFLSIGYFLLRYRLNSGSLITTLLAIIVNDSKGLVKYSILPSSIVRYG